MWTFRAMNTDVAVAAPTLSDAAEAALAGEVAAMFADVERRFSRFRPDSELGRLNRATEPVAVSAELFELLLAAGRHVTATGGLFDPAVGGALEQAGYDRSFAAGALDRAAPDGAPAPRARFAELRIEPATRVVARPPHLHLDLGGFVKGRTADRAAALLPGAGVIDAGGDAVLRGAPPDAGAWAVDVEDPADPRRIVATLRVSDRAVATSAPNRRRWRDGAAIAHHLIDPRTGRPARSDLAQVTAIAPTAEAADVLAKTAFVLGAAAGAAWLGDRSGIGGVLVALDGSVRIVGDVEVGDA